MELHVSAYQFSVYTDWLHDGFIFISQETDKNRRWRNQYRNENGIETLLSALRLSSKLGDKDYQDAIMDHLVERMSAEGFHARLPEVLYNITAVSSPARKLAVAFAAVKADDKTLLDDYIPWTHQAFRDDLFKFMVRARHDTTQQAEFSFDNLCQYHEHATGNCYRNRFKANQDVVGEQPDLNLSDPIQTDQCDGPLLLRPRCRPQARRGKVLKPRTSNARVKKSSTRPAKGMRLVLTE